MVLRLSQSPRSGSESLHSTPPPPPYKASVLSPIILAGTTTTKTETVTTTTETTTHFFSLPSWRKRGTTAFAGPRRSSSSTGIDEYGVMGSTPISPFLLDKDLPPTPPCEGDEPFATGEGRRAFMGKSSEKRPSTSGGPSRHPFPASDPAQTFQRGTPPLHSKPATVALVQAALNLGLPHVIPRASTSTQSSQENGVASPLYRLQDPSLSAPKLRRSKSSQKLSTTDENPVVNAESVDKRAQRRSRGLSLGANAFWNFAPDIKGKSKAKEENDNVPVAPQAIQRKPSFWSRKRKSSSHVLPVLPRPSLSDSEDQRRPSLPTMHPVSPFKLDLRVKQSSVLPPHSSEKLHARGLSRSYSERLAPSITSSSNAHPEPSEPPLPSAPLPRAGDGKLPVPPMRPRAQSFFFAGSPPSNRSPMPSHTLVDQRSSRPSTGLKSSAQPRSNTNPAVSHRPSADIPPSPLSAPTHGIPVFLHSFTTSPTPTTSSFDSPRPSLHKPPNEIPEPQSNVESPELYLSRLLTTVSKAEVAGILASSTDPFLVKALRAYIEQFDFTDDPLDVALRKLLMDVGLPRETQQIDRVMEAFANRYLQCNPSLFVSDDHPYIIAFSLIMLHTDAFNKSNKRKMTKPDYVKNTRLPGVAPEVLDCFYDNIVFAPFIFIEDPLDINGQRGLVPEGTPSRLSTISNSNTTNGSTTTLLAKGSKIDPYYLITNNLLGPLRVNVENDIPLENPYSYEGTSGPWNDEDLQRSFAKATVLEMGAVDHQRVIPLSGVSDGEFAGSFPEVLPTTGEVWSLKLTKVGVLNRKDLILERGKKASNRKWKPWSVILTGSQLLLFRDSSWAGALLDHSSSYDGHILFPQVSMFTPDELLSLKDAIAVYDVSYAKYANTFRMIMPDGRQFLLQASDELELNQWISRINYACSFKSAGVRMRPLSMSTRDLELTGVAAATSHLHDLQQLQRRGLGQAQQWDQNTHTDLMGMLSAAPRGAKGRPPLKRKITMMTGRDDVDLEVPVAPEIEGAEQFKATFDTVKAHLAIDSQLFHTGTLSESSPTSPVSTSRESETSRLPSRSQIIQSKIQELESRMSVCQTQLDSNMRFVCNIITLTPFQRSTRDRLQSAVLNISKQIAQVRLDITRLSCYRDVLRNDLVAEKRSWQKAKDTALNAARDILRDKLGSITAPLSFHSSEHVRHASLQSPAIYKNRSESSICESFHSALDFGPDWPSSDDLTSSVFFMTDSTTRSNSDTVSPLETDSKTSLGAKASPSPSHSGRSSFDVASPSRQDGDERKTHEKFYTAHEASDEQAELWNRTRCAQRVSLVKLPSDTKLSALMERYRAP